MKHTLVIGTDFKRSSLKMRESIHFDDNIKPKIIKNIKSIDGISECVILTTCNRIEIYVVCDKPTAVSSYIMDFLSEIHELPTENIRKKMYIFFCEDVVKHLFRVAAGLESMVIGEPQILGQIRDAYLLSKKVGGSGPYLNKLFQTALALGKQVRTETEINNGITSIGSAAAKQACDIADPKESSYLVVGCGEMGSITAKHLAKRGASKIFLVNRTHSKAKDLSSQIGGEALKFGDLTELLEKSDVVVTATNSKSHLISSNQIKKLGRKLSIIDISIPRNVEPDIADLPNVALFSIDDLKETIDKNMKLRKSSMTKIERFIENKLGFFKAWYLRKLNNDYSEKTENRNSSIKLSTSTDTNCY